MSDTAFFRIGVQSTEAVEGSDRAKKAVRDVGQEADKTARGVQKMQASLTSLRQTANLLTGALGVLGVGFGLQQIIQNTTRQEQAERQLEEAIRRKGETTRFTAQQLKDMASAMQGVTTIGDEVVLEAMNMILPFKNLSDEVIPDLLARAADVSTLMGTSMADAAKQLGKALNDPVTRLGELAEQGIVFSEAQKTMVNELVESGRLLDAQRVILDELQRMYGGAAQAARDTFGGALQAVQNAFGDLLEIGRFVPRVIVDGLNLLADNMQNVAKAGIGLMALGLPFYFQALSGAVTLATASLARLFATISRHPLGALATAVAFVVTELYLFRDAIYPLQDSIATLGDFGRAALSMIAEELQGVRAWVGRVSDEVSDWVRTFMEGMDSIDFGLTFIGQLWRRTMNAAINAMEAVARMPFIVARSLRDNIGGALEGLADAFAAFWNGVKNQDFSFPGLRDALSRGLAGPVKDVIGQIGDDVAAIMGQDRIGAAFDRVGTALVTSTTELRRRAEEFARARKDAEAGATGGAAPGLPSAAPAAAGGGTGAAANELREQLAALQFERAQMERNNETRAAYNALKSAGVDVNRLEAGSMDQLLPLLSDEQRAVAGLAAEIERENAAREQAKAIEEGTRDQIEALEFERAQMMRTADAQSAYNALKSAGIDVSRMQAQSVAELLPLLDAEQRHLAMAAVENQRVNEQRERANQAAEAKNATFSDLAQEIEYLETMIHTYNLSNREREIELRLLQARQQLQAQGVTLSDQEIARLRDMAAAATDANMRLNHLGSGGSLSLQRLQEAGGAGLLSLENSLVDIATRSKTANEALADFAENMARIFAQMAIRAAIIGPMAAMFGIPMFAAGGVMTAQGPINLTAYARGGVMTEHGDLPLKAYQSGGIANRPQLAMFGEGTQPEAYVPLPDGRRIPVALEGKGAVPAGGVVNHFDIDIAVPPGTDMNQAEQLAGQMRRQMEAMVVDVIRVQSGPGGVLNPYGTRGPYG